MENNFYPFVNLPLPYSCDALEPFIDEQTMQLHHGRHLQTYIENLNETLKDHPSLQRLSLDHLLQNCCRIPQALQTPVCNNAGGVFNHRFFFECLANPAQERPDGPLAAAIDRTFGSFDNCMSNLRTAALSVFGSGYAWLVDNYGKLKIITTANQDTPLAQGSRPILTIDVWEHSYYLKHYTDRVCYFENWCKVINWKKASENYLQSQPAPLETGCCNIHPNFKGNAQR